MGLTLKDGRTGSEPMFRGPRFWRKLLPSVMLAGAVIALVSQIVGWGELFGRWPDFAASWVFAVPLLLVSYASRGMRIARWPLTGARLGIEQGIYVAAVHNFAVNTLPFRAGEAVFPMLCKHHFGVTIQDSLVTLLLLRILDVYVLLGLGALLWRADETSPVALEVIGLWTAFGIAMLLLLSRGHRRSNPGMLERLLARLSIPLVRVSPRAWFEALGWTALGWTAKVASFSLVLGSVIGHAPFDASLGVMGGELSSLSPLQPIAGVGMYEGGVVAGLALVGVPFDVALSGAVYVHVFLLACAALGTVMAVCLRSFSRRAPAGSAADS